MRKRLVIANWKMNGSLALVDEMVAGFSAASHVDVIVAPPSVYVFHLTEVAAGSFGVGLQDVSQFESGAHTGDLSAAMMAELGATAVLVGHSERRSEHGETDATVAAKGLRVLAAGMMPVICVGESLAERESGQAEAKVRAQIEAQADCLRFGGEIAIAYEPVWAIGTGKSASALEAVAMHREIRRVLQEVTAEYAQGIRILYGGSVNGENAAELFSHDEIEGVLVGGASLDTEQFAAIIRAADV
ncbi:MAG: triose-phosphate isomerase [Proteobacteria bacterium]|jgi:triosephosphate isomerase|nr:triose-phosphate isomerase [Pseudomonadota bacterium]